MRPALWLTTLSTVVAVATGMFTLRNQIFPTDSGTASAASQSAFRQSIGGVCGALNQEQTARVANEAQLRARLSGARTAGDQRDAVLDSWTVTLGLSAHDLASFEAARAPVGLRREAAATLAAWMGIVAQERSVVERLQQARNSTQLIATVATLPRLEADISQESVTRAAGLQELGGAQCTLLPPSSTESITLPEGKRDVPAVAVSGAPRLPKGSYGPRGSAKRPVRPIAPVVNPTPPAPPAPSLAHGPVPAVIGQPVNPPASATGGTPPVGGGAHDSVRGDGGA